MNKFIVQLRSQLLVFLTHHLALPLLKFVRSPKPFPYTRDGLHQMPEGSLGKELISMLDRKKLELLPYYAQHDIKHVLLQYDTTDEGEVCLQFFMLGNRHFSFPVLATVFFGILTMPTYMAKFKAAYRRGQNSSSLDGWQWYGLLHQPVLQLRQSIKR